MCLDESKMPQGIRVGGARLLACYNEFWTSFFILAAGSAVVPPSAPIWSEETRANIRVLRRRSVF